MAYVFLKLRTSKDVVIQMSKKSCLRRPFDKATWLTVLSTPEICTAADLSYLLITVEEGE